MIGIYLYIKHFEIPELRLKPESRFSKLFFYFREKLMLTHEKAKITKTN
jgi:hypothetical protein